MIWRNILRAGWIALVFTLAGLAVAKINLFGLQAASGERADDVAHRLGLVGYGYASHRPDEAQTKPRPGQDRVRVVYIDDAALAALKPEWSGWPPGYANLALMIQDVATPPGIQPARAVFVDLEITGENLTGESEAEFTGLIDTVARLTRAVQSGTPGWGSQSVCLRDALTKLACMVEWGGVPVILASGESYSPHSTRSGSPPTAQDRLEAVALLAPILVDFRAYPLAAPRLPPETTPALVQPGAYDLYPSAAMYAANCLVEASRRGHDICGVPAIEKARAVASALRNGRTPPVDTPVWRDLERSWRQPLAVEWSQDASPRQNQLWGQTSGEGFKPNCKTRQSLGDLLDQAVGTKQARQGADQACTYTLSLGYDRIVEGYGLSREHDYPDLLSDKLALIGVYFRGSDWAPTPLHGALPGVQYHAMALDNLLERGRDYRRNEGEGVGRGDVFASALTFLLIFGVNLASIEKRRITGPRGRFRPLFAVAWYGALAAIILVTLAFCIVVAMPFWTRAIVNWIGILSAVFTAAWFTARTDISGDLAGWMKRTPAGKAVLDAASKLDQSLQPTSTLPKQDRE